MYSLDRYRATIPVSCRYCPPPALTRPEVLLTLKAKFYDAVARVVLDQPHVRVGIIDEDAADPYFVRLFRLDFARHIEWRTIGDSGQLEPEYLQSMQTQLDSRFDDISNQPGWRIIVLHVAASDSIEVLYVWNHPHHDGMSGKIFHPHLLGKLNEGFALDPEPVLKHADRARGLADGWSARRAEPVLSAELPSAAISNSLMTVEDEQMCVTCSWQDCVVDAELGARVLGDLERWLNETGS